MFQEINQSYITRQSKTSEPRFKRITQSQRIQHDPKMHTQQNFPTVSRGNALDNSKQNLHYENYLSKVKSTCRIDEKSIVSKYLNSLRKDYDEMSKYSRCQMMSVRAKKREIQFLRDKNMDQQKKRQEISARLLKAQKGMAETKQKYEDAKMQTKTLENIILRMRQDEIFYKQFGRVREEELKRKMKDSKAKQEALIHEDEKIHKLLSQIAECKSGYGKNKQLRMQKFEDYRGIVGDAEERDKFLQDRRERTYELQSIELNDTLDEKNIHMREITLANKVADALLEFRVNGLIRQYADVQNAFHLVKVKTCVNDPALLTSKFFSYEDTAQKLMHSITQLQRRQEMLMQNRQELQDQYKNLVNSTLEENQTKGHRFQANQNQKQKLISQINENRLLVDKIQNWLEKRLVQAGQTLPNHRQGLDETFARLCGGVATMVKQCQNSDIFQRKFQTTGIRIKKLVREITSQEMSSKIKETQEMNQSNLAQEQFMYNSRQNVIKKNFQIKQRMKRQSCVFK